MCAAPPELTQVRLQRLRGQQEAATRCCGPGGDAELHGAALEARGSADAALEARHRSPLYRHVPVEPQLHEAGLQVGVRHVQQHLYAAHGKAASQRADDAALLARQSGTVEAPLFWPPELHNT